MKFLRYTLFIPLIALVITSCLKDKATPDYGGYPDEVGKIVFNKCATAGCHNDQSKNAAAGLSLESWEKMFEGGSNSAVVIPYSLGYSTLFSFSNIYEDLGHTLTPTMPYGRTPLSREELVTLKEWIEAGAPNRDGFVKFSDNPQRKKLYVANQGCDAVTVIDAETLLPMRYINVGWLPGTDGPHMVRVAPDGQHWYVVFINSNSGSSSILQKFRTTDDALVANITIPLTGSWNTFSFSNDSKRAFLVDWAGAGKVAHINLETNQFIEAWGGLVQPHGSAMSPAGDSLYVTAQTGNFVYKISLSDPSTPNMVSLEPTVPPTSTSSLNIHEIAFTPDGSKYLVTCQGTDDIRIVQASNDNVIAVIPVPAGSYPSEISMSATHDYAFVTLMEDITSFPGTRGSVAVIDLSSNTLVKYIKTGFQPHGIAVDDAKNLVYVANRNATTAGPAPHHTNNCGGRNGYLTYIDMNTLELVPGRKMEVSADPYSIAIRP